MGRVILMNSADSALISIFDQMSKLSDRDDPQPFQKLHLRAKVWPSQRKQLRKPTQRLSIAVHPYTGHN